MEKDELFESCIALNVSLSYGKSAFFREVQNFYEDDEDHQRFICETEGSEDEKYSNV